MNRAAFALITAALTFSGVASADAVSDGCKKMREEIKTKGGDQCSAEYAEASASACASKDDLSNVMKLEKQCIAKLVKGTGATPSTTTTAAPSKTDSSCRAVTADGTEIATATDPKLSGCMSAIKEKVKAAKCGSGGDKADYLLQVLVSAGKWTKGAKMTVKCK